MTLTPELRRARAAARRLEQALDARDEAIRAAAERHSLQQVADAVGLSKPRVHQIVRSAA